MNEELKINNSRGLTQNSKLKTQNSKLLNFGSYFLIGEAGVAPSFGSGLLTTKFLAL
jgi:hypothetical protein